MLKCKVLATFVVKESAISDKLPEFRSKLPFEFKKVVQERAVMIAGSADCLDTIAVSDWFKACCRVQGVVQAVIRIEALYNGQRAFVTSLTDNCLNGVENTYDFHCYKVREGKLRPGPEVNPDNYGKWMETTGARNSAPGT